MVAAADWLYYQIGASTLKLNWKSIEKLAETEKKIEGVKCDKAIDKH